MRDTPFQHWWRLSVTDTLICMTCFAVIWACCKFLYMADAIIKLAQK